MCIYDVAFTVFRLCFITRSPISSLAWAAPQRAGPPLADGGVGAMDPGNVVPFGEAVPRETTTASRAFDPVVESFTPPSKGGCEDNRLKKAFDGA